MNEHTDTNVWTEPCDGCGTVHTVPTPKKRRVSRWRAVWAALLGAALTATILVPAAAATTAPDPTCTPTVCTDPYPFPGRDCKSVATCSDGLYPLRRPPVLGEAPTPVVAVPTLTG